jgi:DNA-binding MarR family transcriptional regulator
MTDTAGGDNLDRIVAQWAAEKPELNTSSMATVGRLLRAGRIVEREVERELARFGLNQSEFNVLAALRRSGEPYQLSPAELSSMLLLSSGGLTKRIDRLHQAGFVMRAPDPEDGRGLLVGLTTVGNEILEVSLAAHVKNEERALAALDLDQRAELDKILRTLLLAYGDGGYAHVGRAFRRERRKRAVAAEALTAAKAGKPPEGSAV